MTENIFLIGAFILLFVSCRKEPSGDALPTRKPVYFSGITITTETGHILKEDVTDWRTDDIWNKTESNLFGIKFNPNCTENKRIANLKISREAIEDEWELPKTNKILLIPNPIEYGNNFTLFFKTKDSTKVEIRLVDKNFHTLLSKDNLIEGEYSFSADSLNITDTVRLYYRFIRINCEHRGHGDILFSNLISK